MSPQEDLRNSCLLPTQLSGNRIGWHIGRVDNWIGRWENLEKAQECLLKTWYSLMLQSGTKKVFQAN